MKMLATAIALAVLLIGRGANVGAVFPRAAFVARGTVQWHPLKTVSETLQADANLIRLPNGDNFLIDAGEAGYRLVPLLESLNVKRLKKIFVSHGHGDHYNGILSLLDSKILVDEVYFNLPLRQVCDSEKPWGCKWEEIQTLAQKLSDRKIPLRSMKRGDVLFRNGEITLRVLYAYGGINTPVGKTDVNDTSVILRLTNKNSHVLFTGDLNSPLGTYLAATGDPDLKAELLKVPHHGTEGAAPNEFFDLVAPRLAIVPSPRGLWDTPRSRRIRRYFETKKIPTYVTGAESDFRVILTETDQEILLR